MKMIYTVTNTNNTIKMSGDIVREGVINGHHWLIKVKAYGDVIVTVNGGTSVYHYSEVVDDTSSFLIVRALIRAWRAILKEIPNGMTLCCSPSSGDKVGEARRVMLYERFGFVPAKPLTCPLPEPWFRGVKLIRYVGDDRWLGAVDDVEGYVNACCGHYEFRVGRISVLKITSTEVVVTCRPGLVGGFERASGVWIEVEEENESFAYYGSISDDDGVDWCYDYDYEEDEENPYPQANSSTFIDDIAF